MTNGLVYLRVKGKSLADEARIIRKEEDRERRKPVESSRSATGETEKPRS